MTGILTQQEKADLHAVGFSDEQIDVLTSAEAEEIITATNVVVTNTREVREFFKIIVAQARAATKDIKAPGVLQMILVHPLAKNYDDVVVYRYQIGDPTLVGRMTKDAADASATGHNVYVETRLVRPGLRGKKRGTKEDTVAVFALVVDSDSDKGKEWMPTVPVSLAVETSPGNAHDWLFFVPALDATTGERLGERLRAMTNADADTGVITQPFRVAGTVNYPSKQKQERGRTEIMPTSVRGFDPGSLWTPERFEQEFPLVDPKINGGGGQTNGTATPAGDIDESSVAADTLRTIRDGVEDDDRSYVFFNVVKALKDDGWTLTGVVTLLDRYPKGIARKYRGRLQREVERVWTRLARPSQARQQQGPPVGISPPPSSPPPPPPPGAQPGAGPAAPGPQPGTTAIGNVLKVFQKWLILSDWTPVYAALGTVAANLLPGDPVWLGLIAPPSSAKTEILNALSKIPNVKGTSTLTEAALLSGTPRQQQAATARGGLREIGQFGFIVLKDFGSVLDMRPDDRSRVLAALREIFDGNWTRRIGVDGGKTLHWSGKIGILFGATNAIDTYYNIIAKMGDRFLFNRLTPSDDQFEHALNHVGAATALMRQELRDAVATLFAGQLRQPEKITPNEIQELKETVLLTVRLRGAVERDSHSREFLGAHGAEGPARLGLTLERLLAGLDTLGVDRLTGLGIVKRVAMDSVPPNRRCIYEFLQPNHDVDTATIARAINLPTTTTRRALEELTSYKLAIRSSAGGQGRADLWRKGQ